MMELRCACKLRCRWCAPAQADPPPDGVAEETGAGWPAEHCATVMRLHLVPSHCYWTFLQPGFCTTEQPTTLARLRIRLSVTTSLNILFEETTFGEHVHHDDATTRTPCSFQVSKVSRWKHAIMVPGATIPPQSRHRVAGNWRCHSPEDNFVLQTRGWACLLPAWPSISLLSQDCYLTLCRPQRKDNRPDIHSNQLFSQKFSHNRPFQGDLDPPSAPDKNG